MCVEDGCMYNLSPDSPIGIMDSGMGGISVLREIVKVLPNEDFIFYGDSANAPYGSRSNEEIYGLTERAVEGRLYRIKARLRQRMGGERP